MAIATVEEVLEDLEFFDDWEERYKYIIDLGKELEPLDDGLKTDVRLVKGCQSNVWLDTQIEGQLEGKVEGQFDGAAKLHFVVDSDAVIVKGLLALILAAYDHKSAAEILDFDVDAYFNQLDLERHLSPTRGNGLRAIVAKIRAIAEASN